MESALVGRHGGGTEASELVVLLYEDVKRIARRQRRRFVPGDTCGTTALVNEAYRKLVQTPTSSDSQHDLRAIALAMRRVITDLARTKPRTGRFATQPSSPDAEACEVADALWLDGGRERIVAIDDALERLERLNPRLADVVNCRFFAGFSGEEAARALGVPERTLNKDWAKARAWLYREIGPDI